MALVLVGMVAGCSSTGGGRGGSVQVVAAENFWGSIASQIGGVHANVTSVIVDPAQDPHSYEPKTADARTLATATLAIVNGAGYDAWAAKLLSANPSPGRLSLNVGDLLGLHEGDNPHRWYDPVNVATVAGAIGHDLARLDPAHAAYFRRELGAFESRGLARYHALIAQIKRRYAGTPVGASESVFALLAPALGLRLITPERFMNAISEGTEVSAQDTLLTQRQIAARQVKVWIYNSQNTTPQIQRLNELARTADIPIARITETLSPAGASFETWQVDQLDVLAGALRQATGR